MINITKIYLVTNCFNDPNKIYIGKTKNCRKKDHQRKFGDNITYDYIDEVESLDRKDWKPLECFWIEYFRQLGFDIQNENPGGGGLENHSQISKDKISKANKGRVQSKEHKLKLGLIRKGRKYSKESVELRRLKLLGRKQTQEEKEKRVKAISKPILQYDLEGNFIKEWPSATIAAQTNSWKISVINNCVRGNSKKSYNYQWFWKIEDFPLKIEKYIFPRIYK